MNPVEPAIGRLATARALLLEPYGLDESHLQRALALAGFERVARRERVGGFVYTEIWVKEQGVGSRE